MRKWLLTIGILLGVGLLAQVIYGVRQRAKDKSLSPEAKVKFEDQDWEMGIFYNRPFARGRKIFGGLVPFHELWRTGANEATVFYTDEAIELNGQRVPSGRFQLITIPAPDKWTIILNSDIPGWGVETTTGKTYHNPKTDIVRTEAKVEATAKFEEQFTIDFQKEEENVWLLFKWENTLVRVAIQRAKNSRQP